MRKGNSDKKATERIATSFAEATALLTKHVWNTAIEAAAKEIKSMDSGRGNLTYADTIRKLRRI